MCVLMGSLTLISLRLSVSASSLSVDMFPESVVLIILSENSILIGDMNFSNIIFGKNGIKVIDFDNYNIL